MENKLSKLFFFCQPEPIELENVARTTIAVNVLQYGIQGFIPGSRLSIWKKIGTRGEEDAATQKYLYLKSTSDNTGAYV